MRLGKPVGLDELILRIRHVGVCVYDLEKSIELFKKLFDVKDEDIQFWPPLGVDSDMRYAAMPVAGTEIILKQYIFQKKIAALYVCLRKLAVH